MFPGLFVSVSIPFLIQWHKMSIFIMTTDRGGGGGGVKGHNPQLLFVLKRCLLSFCFGFGFDVLLFAFILLWFLVLNLTQTVHFH